MSRQISEQKTLTSNTVSFDSDNSEYASMASGYPAENGIGDGSGTYAGFNMTTGSRAETIILYNFDCSLIPEDAEINSVSCRARAATSSTTTNYINIQFNTTRLTNPINLTQLNPRSKISII